VRRFGEAFDLFDSDQSGSIDAAEATRLVRAMYPTISKSELRAALRTVSHLERWLAPRHTF
jgi:Ca2+-binding EF-hand superfamily protein